LTTSGAIVGITGSGIAQRTGKDHNIRDRGCDAIFDRGSQAGGA
jgi:hypothetical protein